MAGGPWRCGAAAGRCGGGAARAAGAGLAIAGGGAGLAIAGGGAGLAIAGGGGVGLAAAGGGAGRDGGPGLAAGAPPLLFSPGCAEAPPNVASAKETLSAIAAMRTPKRNTTVLLRYPPKCLNV